MSKGINKVNILRRLICMHMLRKLGFYKNERCIKRCKKDKNTKLTNKKIEDLNIIDKQKLINDLNSKKNF